MAFNKEDQKKYYLDNKSKYYLRSVKNLYGMSEKEYLELVNQQNGKCKLCQQERKLNVDHCHETGRVRGLLCLGCNAGLGMLGDNEEGLTKALNYLKGIN